MKPNTTVLLDCSVDYVYTVLHYNVLLQTFVAQGDDKVAPQASLRRMCCGSTITRRESMKHSATILRY